MEPPSALPPTCVPWQGLLLTGEGNNLGLEQEDCESIGCATASCIWHSSRDGPDLGGKGMKKRQVDTRTHREAGMGGLGSLVEKQQSLGAQYVYFIELNREEGSLRTAE